jgi:hypothetical protein
MLDDESRPEEGNGYWYAIVPEIASEAVDVNTVSGLPDFHIPNFE